MKELDRIRETRLREVSEGIFSLDGVTNNRGQLVVAVHPYFACEYYINEEIGFPLDYPAQFDRLVQKHDGILITLEGSDTFDKTVSKYRRLGRLEGRYIIPTDVHDPIPLVKWDPFIEFIKNIKREKPVALAGGYLYSSQTACPGCLGRTAYMFRENGIDFDFLFDLIYPNYNSEEARHLIRKLFREGLSERQIVEYYHKMKTENGRKS